MARIIVVVSGGVVTGVYTDIKDVDLCIYDFDNALAESRLKADRMESDFKQDLRENGLKELRGADA